MVGKKVSKSKKFFHKWRNFSLYEMFQLWVVVHWAANCDWVSSIQNIFRMWFWEGIDFMKNVCSGEDAGKGKSKTGGETPLKTNFAHLYSRTVVPL
jgi:hypothetical protein